MLLLFLSLAFASRVLAQDCTDHACYPQPRELTVGHGNKLHASSTCGLQESQSYCTAKVYHGRELLQCCVCDSRNEYNPVYFTNSHRIGNVVPSGALRSWWQSENDQDQVSIQLDVGGKLQLHDVLVQFKSPRPAAMMIERSNDFGRTWKPYQYIADDCAASFPGIATGRPRDLADVRCQQQLRTQEPSDEQVMFNPLSLADHISVPTSDKINNLAPFTNLRINFVKPYKSPTSQNLQNVNTFYAVYEVKIRGSCFCNGHASSCAAAGSAIMTPRGPRPTTYGQCVCKHNTVGSNCEQCASLYNDQPWRPADDQSTNACKKCDCNNHSQRCHFDADVHRANGGVRGGVCDSCQHNTMGNNCERCQPPFRRDPRREITAADACVAFACDCDAAGSLGDGACDPVTQRCSCKQNVEGARCDRCKSGFYHLLATNPAGCQRCACSEQGSEPGRSCSEGSGQCRCLPHVVGPTCDRCAQGFWNLQNRVGCTACKCHPTNSYSLYCDKITGQCPCRTGTSGRTCGQSDPVKCPDHYYSLGTECVQCDCNNHSQRCHFDADVHRANGGVRGGVCDSCQHNTMGNNCERCQPPFRRDPRREITAADACVAFACDCDAAGSLGDGACDPVTQRCSCKQNVEGARCDRCKSGFYRLLATNPAGCQRCACSEQGSEPGRSCSEGSGQCRCLPHVVGPTCDRCAQGFWNLQNRVGCTACKCHPTNSYSLYCDKITGQCPCRTGTSGRTCGQSDPVKCPDHYYSLGTECVQCDCNNHSQRCHFDADVHRANGGVRGGVCDSCQHNTMGNNCERCQPPFRRDPRREITAADACVAFACDCDAAGSLGDGACDPVTQRCSCKQNVEGARCDRCKSGFYRLLATNPAGCQRCACSEQGSEPGRSCRQSSGQCRCLPHVVGPTCDRCAQGFWNLQNRVGCTACKCHPTNSYSLYCDKITGQCPCRAGTSGRTCGQSDPVKCPDHYYSLGTECVRCECDSAGSEQGACDKATGRCLCRPGFTGQRCDECERARGYCSDFPECRQCHPCFLIMDKELGSITVRHKALVNIKLPGQASGRHDSQILALNNRLQQIQAIISNPAVSNTTITDMYNKYIQLRLETDQVNPDVGGVDQNVRLVRELEELKGDVRNIQRQVRVKNEQLDHYIAEGSHGTQGAFTSILSSYQRSGRARGRVTAVEPDILKARDARFTAKRLESHLSPDNGLKLREMKEGLKTPDINPLISKVCGGSRGDPCTAASCEGPLCPTSCAGPDCRGAVQLARKAIEDAERGSTAVPDVANRITQLSRKLQRMEQLARQAKDNAMSLTYRAIAAKDQMQRNLAAIKSLVSQVKDFLSSARADPEEIQRISEYVLTLRLPTDATAIGERIRTLRDIAARLPDVSQILAHTQHDVDKANALLAEARAARDRAGEVKDDIGAAAEAVRDAGTALRKVDEGIGKITGAISSAQQRLGQTEGVLVNAERSLQDMSSRLAPLADQINGLMLKNKANTQRAQALEQSANDALDTGEEAQKKLKELIPEYEKLQNKVPDTLPKDVMDRVHRVKAEAGHYLNRFTELTRLIETTEQMLASGNKELETRSAQLEDYQNKVVEIKTYIESQARYYNHCSP